MRRLLRGALLSLVVVLPAGAQSPVRLTLAEALLRADSASEVVGLARAGVLRARSDEMRARSGYLPQISGAATYTRTIKSQFSAFAADEGSDSIPAPTGCGRFLPNPNLPLPERIDSIERGLDCAANGSGFDFSNLPFGRANTYNFMLSASQALFNPRLGGQRRAAAAGRERAEIALDAARTNAIVAVTEAYFDAQLADRLTQIAESSFVQAERSFNDTRLAREVGNVAEFELLRAGVARDNLRPVVIQRRAQRTQAMLRLRQLLDLPTDDDIVLATPLSDTTAVPVPPFAAALAAAGDTAIANRAPVREAEAGLRASEALLASARGGRLPSLNLSGSYAKIAFPERVFGIDDFLTDASVSLRLDVPIFTGGRTRADVMAAEAGRDEAALRLRQAREQATREAVDARTVLEAAEAVWEASRGTVEQAQRAYAIAEVRYREGISTQTELSDARLLLQQAEANRAQAARDLQVARVRSALLRDLPFGGMPVSGAF
jgi:outer membrane protein